MKRVLKIIAVIFLFFAVLIGFGIYRLGSQLPDMCGNEIVREVMSPDNALKAVIFQRDCGATTGFSTQISLIARADTLANEAGNVFIAKGHPSDRNIELSWHTPQELLIRNTYGLQIKKKEGKYRDISIRYE